MIIRLRSPEGQHRIHVEPSQDLIEIVKKASEVLKVPSDEFQLYGDMKNTQVLVIQPGRTIASVGLKHGDMLFAAFHKKESMDKSQENEQDFLHPRFIKQREIDDQLEKMDGLIKRGKSNLCKHGSSGMCDYCMPLEPYDPSYLEQNKIKHASFHGFLKKVINENKTAPTSSAKFIPPLEITDFKVRIPCPSKTHGPYPQGICTKCQPSSATLQTQSFRMVDHIEFESAGIIDDFLRFWRSSAYQRFGVLYGRYEPYLEVPLGIKAVVCAIYEPPQNSDVDYIQLQDDPKRNQVKQIAKALNLEEVGIIYTDLIDDGSGQGTVVCKRHDESYFLSSAECIFSAKLQQEHPIPCKYSPTGSFGSRMVTCVVSGNEEGHIEISAYQVSNIGMSMVRDDIIEASIEPSLMRVKPSSDIQYVPEVFYKYKNNYGIMVKEAANPTFPVEYLLVTLSHGFPSSPNPTFIGSGFPVENRGGLESQSMEILKKQLSPELIEKNLSDFHLLVYLADTQILEKDALSLACQYASVHDPNLLHQLMSTNSWQTLNLILKEAKHEVLPSMNTENSASAATASASAPWACQFCTFVNESGGQNCEMCGLPKNGQ